MMQGLFPEPRDLLCPPVVCTEIFEVAKTSARFSCKVQSTHIGTLGSS